MVRDAALLPRPAPDRRVLQTGSMLRLPDNGRGGVPDCVCFYRGWRLRLSLNCHHMVKCQASTWVSDPAAAK
jgi:hypothetical protein